MFHAHDTVRIKGQNVTESAHVVVRVEDGIATLRYWATTSEFHEFARNLELVKCGHDNGPAWSDFTPRDFDTTAKDQPLALFGAPDECGSFATLFDA